MQPTCKSLFSSLFPSVGSRWILSVHARYVKLGLWLNHQPASLAFVVSRCEEWLVPSIPTASMYACRCLGHVDYDDGELHVITLCVVSTKGWVFMTVHAAVVDFSFWGICVGG